MAGKEKAPVVTSSAVAPTTEHVRKASPKDEAEPSLSEKTSPSEPQVEQSGAVAAPPATVTEPSQVEELEAVCNALFAAESFW